jgi:low-affinity inorganic phosphate transporter
LANQKIISRKAYENLLRCKDLWALGRIIPKEFLRTQPGIIFYKGDNMDFIFPAGALPVWGMFFLALSLLVSFAFEFVNGFHDTANAVATVIYTKSMRPVPSVLISGLFNFTGVILGGLGVAFTILHLLPVDLLVNIDSYEGLSMIGALLMAAIVWNLGTWWKGLPASSSHTLIGSIIGVGLANALLNRLSYGSSITWASVRYVFLSLLISPVLGFVFAALAMKFLHFMIKDKPEYFAPANTEGPPPFLMRMGIIASSIGVSFSHGANDGQKGIGLIMLILIGILPAKYALNSELKAADIRAVYTNLEELDELLVYKGKIINKMVAAAVTIPGGAEDSFVSPLVEMNIGPLCAEIKSLLEILKGSQDLSSLDFKKRWEIRTRALAIDEALSDLVATGRLRLDIAESHIILKGRASIRELTDYAPLWVIFGVALALGSGTMIGWRRIVVTIGERIGKAGISYAQGLSAQVVAAVTIMLGNYLQLPVSTTQVLSSGVAGTMTAERTGLQLRTVRNILLAWVLTLPASMLLSAFIYIVLRAVTKFRV